MILKILISMLRCVWLGLELNSAGKWISRARFEYPWCSISSSFQNSLKTSGHRGYEFLEFWCWNLVPFLPDIGFQLLKSFSFNDVPNVLYRWKIWDCEANSAPGLFYIYIYIYAFSRRFYPERLTLHSSYSFTFDQLLLSWESNPWSWRC